MSYNFLQPTWGKTSTLERVIRLYSATCVKKHLIPQQQWLNTGTTTTSICMSVDHCGKGFHFESQLREHLRVHQAQGDWTCFRPKCGKRFKRESELNAHLIAHNKKEYKCDECAYSNTNPRNLRAHERRHSDKKPFLCPKCGKGFKWVQQRKRHLEAKTCA